MKNLTWKLVLPLTIISFALFTKYWHVTVGGDDFTEVLRGFPFPYTCPGWHTSLSTQIFLTELVANVVSYFAFWFLLFYGVNRYVKTMVVPKRLYVVLLISAGIIAVSVLVWLVVSHQDNVYYLARPFEIEVIDTEYGW